jgi:hypothetical protein
MQPEMDCRFWTDNRAVLEVDEFNLGAGRGWGGSSLGGGLRKGGRREEKADNDRNRPPSHPPHDQSPLIFRIYPKYLTGRLGQFTRLAEASRPNAETGQGFVIAIDEIVKLARCMVRIALLFSVLVRASAS